MLTGKLALDENAEIIFIDEFEYDDYGTYLEYCFVKDGKQYYGFENIETFNFESIIRKPVVEDYGKFMNHLYEMILGTENGMVYLDAYNEYYFDLNFRDIEVEDIVEFLPQYKKLCEENSLWNVAEIYFNENDFQQLKNGNYECAKGLEYLGILYGDFLCFFNREVQRV